MNRLIQFLVLPAILIGQTRLPPKQSAPPAPAAHQRSTGSKGTSHTRTGGSAASVSDAEIEKKFREKLAKSKSATEDFTIHVQSGVATLEGKTEVVQRKGTATRMAKSAGARTVVNKIVVSDAAREKAAGNLATGRRRAQVKRSEVAHR